MAESESRVDKSAASRPSDADAGSVDTQTLNGHEPAIPRLSSARADSYAPCGYDSVAAHYDAFYGRRLDLAEDAVVHRAIMREPPVAMLDLGCGNGAAARLVSGAILRRYVGTDISTGMLSRWRTPHLSVDLSQADWKTGVHFFDGLCRYDILLQSMTSALPSHIFREFDLVTILWSLCYLDAEAAFNALLHAASQTIPGGRLVMTLYTRRFIEDRERVLQSDHPPSFVVDDWSFLRKMEAATPWKITKVRGLTGPLSIAADGRFYPLTSMIDRFNSAFDHRYVLVEAVR